MDLFHPTEEHKMLREMLQSFVLEHVEPQALEYDRKENFNLALFKKLGPLGLLGITVSPEYGGGGMDPVSAVIVHEELSYSDPGFCLAYLAHSMLCVNNLFVNGDEEQKKRLLPGLCSGEKVGCMAMSEPHMGTDVLGMKTEAKKQSDHYLVNGSKMWITNGTVDENKTPADLVLLYAQTEPKDGKKKISTFLVEKGHEGYSVGQKIKDKTGMRSSNTAELVFKSCKVPQENRLGEEGNSWSHMMKNLELERLTLAAMSLGIAKRCVKAMVKYAKERESFGRPIKDFGQIQRYIGESYADYQAAKTYVYNTAFLLGKGSKRVDSDGVKLVASRVGKTVADHAIQVLGGYGYVGEYVVERLWRDAKLLEIGGGTLEAHQKNITTDLSKDASLVN